MLSALHNYYRVALHINKCFNLDYYCEQALTDDELLLRPCKINENFNRTEQIQSNLHLFRTLQTCTDTLDNTTKF